MGIKYYHPDLHGYVENIARRRIHVLTNTGGVDKILFIYRFECDLEGCGFDTTAAGLGNIRKAADRHYYRHHSKYFDGLDDRLDGDGVGLSEAPPF